MIIYDNNSILQYYTICVQSIQRDSERGKQRQIDRHTDREHA